MRESPIGLEAIRIRGEGWEVLAHGGPSIAACKAIMLKSGAILGGFDRRWRRRGSERWTLAKTLGFWESVRRPLHPFHWDFKPYEISNRPIKLVSLQPPL